MINKLLFYLGHSAWGGIAAIATIIGLLIVNIEPDKKENSASNIESPQQSPNNQVDSFGRFPKSQASNVMTPSLEKNIEVKNTALPTFGKFKEKKVIIKRIPALTSAN